MSSGRGSGRGLPAVNSKHKGKVSDTYSPGKIDPNGLNVGDLNLGSNQDGHWEVIGKKGKSHGGPSFRDRVQSEGITRQGWNTNTGGSGSGAGRTSSNNQMQGFDSHRSTGRGNNNRQPSQSGWEASYMAPPPPPPQVRPPLENGWQWNSRGSSLGPRRQEDSTVTELRSQNDSFDGHGRESDMTSHKKDEASDDEYDDDLIDDNDDDDLSDDYDSDVSQRSHGSRKKNKWFKSFFDALDKHTVEEINDQSRQWHCPACQNGPGAVDWYDGLQPLISHAKTKGSQRVKLHREFASLLEEELQIRGSSIFPGGEAFGKWRGLRETIADHEIVWPPMVLVMNTLLEKGDNDKWIGMGNQELLEYFSSYDAVKARHSYGPNGHRGMSILIFEPTAFGYLEAERLHKHFEKQGTDRDAWVHRKVLFYPGGKRQLYGFLAKREDLDVFNQHSQGKSKLKYEMKSYQQEVVEQMKKVSEENQQLHVLKKKAVRHEKRSKTLEESLTVVSEKLRKTMQENTIVRLRTKEYYEENNEEMDRQESFFKEQLNKVRKITEEKEKEFERILQAERAKVKQSDAGDNGKDRQHRKEEFERFIDTQVKGVKEFEDEREKLIVAHEEEKVRIQKKHLEEIVELERKFDRDLTELMKKYTPGREFNSSTNTTP